MERGVTGKCSGIPKTPTQSPAVDESDPGQALGSSPSGRGPVHSKSLDSGFRRNDAECLLR